MNKKKLIFLVILLFLVRFSILAQNNRKLESLIKSSNVEMYENPDKVIATGLKIIKLSNNNVNLKIKAYKLVSDGYSSKETIKNH